MPFLTAPDGVEVHYELPEGEGFPLMFTHGNMGFGQQFFLQTRILGKKYRCILHDLRGCGLSLNVLLSFAQFEREVIGERIRDKVAASKRKGMWMGGTLPMGYDLRERKLEVNHDEARTIRHIFERYLELGSVRLLRKDLGGRGIVSAVKASRNGKCRGGKPFSRGALYCLLSNSVYIDEIRHKQERHPGQHEGIVSRALWERVQERLRERAPRRGEGSKTQTPQSPLGKLCTGR